MFRSNTTVSELFFYFVPDLYITGGVEGNGDRAKAAAEEKFPIDELLIVMYGGPVAAFYKL